MQLLEELYPIIEVPLPGQRYRKLTRVLTIDKTRHFLAFIAIVRAAICPFALSFAST